MPLNINLERYGRLALDGTEQSKLQMGDGVWERAVPTAVAKSAMAQMKPTRVVKNLLNDVNIVTSASDMPSNLNCVYKGYFGTSDASMHIYTDSTKYRVARAQLKAGTYTWWTDTPNCHTLRYSIGGAVGSYGRDVNYYTFTLTEDGEFQMCWRNDTTTEFSGEHSMIVSGSVVPTGYYPFFAPTTVLSSLKVHGKTEKTIVIDGKRYVVPSDVELVTDVTNGSNTNVDTGIYANDNIEMFVRVKAITGSFYIFQARETGTAKIYGISGGQSGNRINFFDVLSDISRTEGHIYTIKGTVVNGAVTVYVKDETTGEEDTKTGTASSYTFPSPTTIKLFGDASKLAAGATVYDAYIKVNGSMAWYMRGAKKNNTVGVFDPISGQFITPTDTLTAGANKPVELYGVGDKVLDIPDEYERVEYIADKSDNGANTVVIDTGIPGGNDDLEFEFEVYYDTYQQYGRVFGNYVADASNGWRLILGTGSEPNYFNANAKCTGGDGVPAFNINNWHKVIFNNQKITVDGTEYSVTHTAQGTANNANISLFSFLSVTNHRYIGLKCRYFKIRDNGTLVRDFIPVKNKATNEYGMYDLVSKQFHGNSGTGTLTGGNAVSPDYEVDILLGSQGVVDLGTLTWTLNASTATPIFSTSVAILGSRTNSTGYYVDGYTSESSFWTIANNYYKIGSGSTNLNISNPNYSTAAEFKAAMSGKYLYYQRTTDTTFIPPVKHSVVLNKQLNGVGDYADSVDFQTGTLTGNMGVKVLDGDTYKFTNVEASGSKYWFYNLDFKIDYISESNFGIVLSDYFVGGYKHIDTTTMSRSGVGFVQILGSAMGGATTVAEANAWLEAHRPIIIYPLATPTTTTVPVTPIALTEKAQYTAENVNTVKGDMQATYLGVST